MPAAAYFIYSRLARNSDEAFIFTVFSRPEASCCSGRSARGHYGHGDAIYDRTHTSPSRADSRATSGRRGLPCPDVLYVFFTARETLEGHPPLRLVGWPVPIIWGVSRLVTCYPEPALSNILSPCDFLILIF